MKRKLLDKLVAWKNSKPKLPLLLYGARQTGKTYLMKAFGKEYYDDVVYINFEGEKKLSASLELSLNPKDILRDIAKLYHVEVVPGKTLLIFDEIQANEMALTSLKYFAEQMPELDIVAAGSLLGIVVHRSKFSFPVGKVTFLKLYPLDFEEFLWARGEELLAEHIRESYKDNKPLPALMHEQLLLLYEDYLLVGGMPAVVQAFLDDGDYQEMQGLIYNSYVADMAKYTEPMETLKIAAVYDSLPAQLAKENKKFQYKVIKTGARANQYAVAIDWLIHASIVLPCYLTTGGKRPLCVSDVMDSFKLYYSDLGILVHKSNLNREILRASEEFRGAVAENYLAMTLMSNGYDLRYWTSASVAEVDFLLEKGNGVLPVEVKAGIHTRSKSLDVFRKRYGIKEVIRVSAKNFGMENGIKSVPLYGAFCI